MPHASINRSSSGFHVFICLSRLNFSNVNKKFDFVRLVTFKDQNLISLSKRIKDCRAKKECQNKTEVGEKWKTICGHAQHPLWILTATYWKHMPIIKLAVQLEKPATAMAAGLGPWENSSATKNQGMGPGPTSKKATKPKIESMLM